MSPGQVPGAEKLRLDKWLWHTRLCKTRSLAASLCAAGQVTVDNKPARPSQTVKSGSAVTIVHGGYQRCLTVTALGTRRGPAEEAERLYREISRRKIKELEPAWERLLGDEPNECDERACGIEEAEG